MLMLGPGGQVPGGGGPQGAAGRHGQDGGAGQGLQVGMGHLNCFVEVIYKITSTKQLNYEAKF